MKAPVDTPRHSDKDHGPGELRVRVLDTRRRPLAGAAVRLSGAETDTLELRYPLRFPESR